MNKQTQCFCEGWACLGQGSRVEGPADVITVLDTHVTTVCYPVHGADSGDVLPTTQQSQTQALISNTKHTNFYIYFLFIVQPYCISNRLLF